MTDSDPAPRERLSLPGAPADRPEPDDGGEAVEARLWRQVESGLDTDRLLPDRDARARDLAKKLDRDAPGYERNGWRMFVSGCAHSMANGKARQKRNAEVMLVETLARWRAQVRDLLPDREADLRAIVAAGLARPEPPPARDGQ